MSEPLTKPESSWSSRAGNVGVALVALLIVAVLVWAMRHYTTPPALTAEQAALRVQNLAELRAAVTEAQESYAWIDEGKGIVRLPVERAMNLTAAAWRNPAAARADLIDRVETATFVPPPPPEEPGEFE
jgi:hypothetical protein